jgi:RecA-family ATPase
VSGLSGDGGAGKTTIACQFCVQVLGHIIDESGPAIFYTSEEPEAEIHFRLEAARQHYGLSWSDLADMHVFCAADYADLDPVLAAWDKHKTKVVTTETFERLRAAALKIRPKLICVENAADVFNVDEIVRKHARDSVLTLKRTRT